MNKPPQEKQEHIPVDRGRMARIVVYDVNEYELSQLKGGGEGSNYLALALFFAALFVSFLVALLTTKIDSAVQVDVFVAATASGGAVAIVMGVLWFRSRSSIDRLVETIRSRMKDRAGPAEDAVEKGIE